MKVKHFLIVILATAAMLFLPLAANADEIWNFWGNQAPFNDPFPPGTTPAKIIGTIGQIIDVTNADSKTIQLQAFADGKTGALGFLIGRNLGTGSDDQGAGVGGPPFNDSNAYEVNGNEAIKIIFPAQSTIPGFASEHLFFNSLTSASESNIEQAHIWADTPFTGISLGTIVHQNVPFEDFLIPQSAWGRPIFVTADNLDFLLYGASVDTQAAVPEPSTMLLLGSGLIALGGYGRKRFLKN